MTPQFRLELQTGEVVRYLTFWGSDPSLYQQKAWEIAEQLADSTGQPVRVSVLRFVELGTACPVPKGQSRN